jgi:D-sedoheptulose 7-phosphate isomerase
MADVTTGAGPGFDLVRNRIGEAVAVKQAMLADDDLLAQVVAVADAIVTALRAGGKVIFFGNGGSSMDAGHLAAELTGRYYYDRPSLAAFSIADSTAAVTAIGNDYCYDDVFSRQLLGLGRSGDIAIGLTTSGNSANVVRALALAREVGMETVVLTGADGGKVAAVAAHCLQVPTTDTPRVQEACVHLGHTICEIVEATMFPRPY